MAIALNTGKVYAGFREPLDLSADILDPTALFNAYKARVQADGGIIPNAAGCKERFDFLVNNGMYENAVMCAAPAFGVKLGGTDGNDILTVYSLLGDSTDLITTSQGTGAAVRYDSTTKTAIVRITSGGGSYLRTRENVRVQIGRSYMIAGRLSDASNADVLGITIGISLSNLPLAYMRTMITNQQGVTESWRFGTRDSAWTGSAAGGAVGAAATTYADYVPAAGLFKVDEGVVYGYSRGVQDKTAKANTGKLADLVNYTAPIIVGGSTASGSVSPCYGTLLDMLFLHTASEPDAILASRFGM
ncbi:TPA: hypothetical protein ACGD7V_002712 [Serratia marcescens]|uniref:hypothetical protein n=1 Tax=Serratia marcescens TaxID=615 RepID=UPI0016606B3B|nr:hypothetical protein [Serratia marcescens]